ncbi:hypothetical protein BAUCODRAFT_24457 [Baudoinia panamericana UAMH 10762]|uniref:Uncharacterized protein n=1 Tax=Baudoinia panamericana (strain UAMH 10762) TaxID=717646 RepID=M2NC49_BAUPA|nr:uncharacterized protein BAUCODRAFT_24457 [Baudoinia panamericana UAMH 10762]EMC96749.1 hypothetical protein BAUCODRAFT_24457 [Baudoinia panamericana UAMH 10762]
MVVPTLRLLATVLDRESALRLNLTQAKIVQGSGPNMSNPPDRRFQHTLRTNGSVPLLASWMCRPHEARLLKEWSLTHTSNDFTPPDYQKSAVENYLAHRNDKSTPYCTANANASNIGENGGLCDIAERG